MGWLFWAGCRGWLRWLAKRIKLAKVVSQPPPATATVSQLLASVKATAGVMCGLVGLVGWAGWLRWLRWLHWLRWLAKLVKFVKSAEFVYRSIW